MGNRSRDKTQDLELRALGWHVLVVWECKLMTDEDVALAVKRVRGLLSADGVTVPAASRSPL